MTDYISREAALEAAKKSHLYFDLKPIIKSVPAADVRPVVRGKWENIRDGIIPCGKCSICWSWERTTNFCPNCGADMRAEEGE